MQIKSSTALRNDYGKISTLAHQTQEPIFITKNGEGDLVVMSIEAFEERDKVLNVIREKGTDFGQRVERIIDETTSPCTFSGIPWMPFITFNHDQEKRYKARRTQFYTELIRKKVFLQPYHHGYICYRHTEEDLNYTLDAIRSSLKSME